MATKEKNLSVYNSNDVAAGDGFVVGILIAEWNSEVTSKLAQGAIATLKKHGVEETNIIVKHVPGTFELTLGGQLMAESLDLDAVICLGCVIKGDTPHFEYICQSVTQGITTLNMEYNIPFVFGVLTTLNMQQALDRAGGTHGNKGDEAAVTALKMMALQRSLEDS
ncbi:MAG: 6,7-dimethyl-8-ribityllumazine synthase [Bacteroidales bacterium]|nr:6,7-dimethyl-8-ribityllumazine synthase [Bacteroidales bacterium]